MEVSNSDNKTQPNINYTPDWFQPPEAVNPGKIIRVIQFSV